LQSLDTLSSNVRLITRLAYATSYFTAKCRGFKGQSGQPPHRAS
jgi:hypothetical protein